MLQCDFKCLSLLAVGNVLAVILYRNKCSVLELNWIIWWCLCLNLPNSSVKFATLMSERLKNNKLHCIGLWIQSRSLVIAGSSWADSLKHGKEAILPARLNFLKESPCIKALWSTRYKVHPYEFRLVELSPKPQTFKLQCHINLKHLLSSSSICWELFASPAFGQGGWSGLILVVSRDLESWAPIPVPKLLLFTGSGKKPKYMVVCFFLMRFSGNQVSKEKLWNQGSGFAVSSQKMSVVPLPPCEWVFKWGVASLNEF